VKEATVASKVFRLGRRPDPWAWPDWAHAHADGTFGNRFDDPRGLYRVLYATSQRVGTFVECLASFRPDLQVVAELAAIAGEAGDDEPIAPGVVPREWVDQRCLGSAALVGDYVDVGHHATLAELRGTLAARVLHHGLLELDAATIRLSAPRAFTQEISRVVFAQSVTGKRRWNGIAYRSKHGDDFENWAVFEPANPVVLEIANLRVDDGDLGVALELHGLRLADPISGRDAHTVTS
jgi:hypothetical protein